MSKKSVTLPKLSKEEFNTAWPAEKSFKYLKKQKDPRFGEVSILKNHGTGEVVFCKEKMVNSEKEATADIMQLKSRMALNSPHMLKMLGYSSKIEKQLCST